MLGREDVDKILESSKFNEIDIENIFNSIFGDLEEYKDNLIINDDVLIDLEVFEGLGSDKENSIFNFIIEVDVKIFIEEYLAIQQMILNYYCVGKK